MLGSPFKQRSHYVFNYKPRYYNERKERLENLKDKYNKENDAQNDKGYRITLTKNNLKNDWAKSKSSAVDTKANRRLAIIIAILVGICAYIFELHTLI